MTTFYIDACTDSNDDAISYFEQRYFTVEKIIDADNSFQMALQLLVSPQKDDSLEEEEYQQFMNALKTRYDSLSTQIKGALSNKIPAQEKDENLDRAYRALLEAYTQVSQNNYSQMIALLQHPDENADSAFNRYYHQASDLLEERVNLFYQATENFAQAKGIEIQWHDQDDATQTQDQP